MTDRLPANSHGAYFIDTAKLRHLFTVGGESGARLDLDFSATTSAGIWQVDDGMIRLREISTDEISAKVLDLTAGSRLLTLADAWLTPPAAPAPETVRIQAQKAAVQERLRAETAACRRSLERLRDDIAAYAKAHQGQLPPALPESRPCGKAPYVYFGPFGEKPPPKFPLVADQPGVCGHPGTVNVLFVDGSIQSFEISADSLKRLCSYLHTIYRYEEKELLQLIERASQLDAGRKQKP